MTAAVSLTVGQLRGLIASLPDDALVLDVATFGPTPAKAALVAEARWHENDRSGFAARALLLASHPHSVEDLLDWGEGDVVHAQAVAEIRAESETGLLNAQ